MPLVQTDKQSSRPKVPSGPRSLNPLSTTLAFKRAPLSFLQTMSQQYGDIWQFRLLKWPIVVLNHPNYLKYILQEKSQRYDKNVFLFEVGRLFAGNGLVTNTDEEDWLRQRRLMQPAFHKQRLAGFATTMVEMTLQGLQRWEEINKEGQPIAVMEEMYKLVMRIVGQTLFSTDVAEQTSIVEHAVTEFNVFLNNYYKMPFPPLWVPTTKNRRFKKALSSLDTVVYDLVSQRRESNEEGGDILSMLIHATDEQTEKRMSNQQLRDEIVTLLTGGGESTTSTLSWTWYLLGLHPEVENTLHDELDRVLGGRVPTVNDFPQLIYTRMIIDEVLRLYPPLWLLMRRAVQDDEIGGYFIPKDTYLLWSTYLLHRNPAIWEDPEQFRPERFLPEQVAKRPRYSSLPFGGGPRICIGNSFALMEMTLIIATVAQRYRLELVPGQVIEPIPLLSLRPNKEIFVYLRPRK